MYDKRNTWHTAKIIEKEKQNTQNKETHGKRPQRTFRISKTEEKYKKTGEIKDSPRPPKPFKKLDPEKLKSYVKANPNVYLKEIGEAFGCLDTAVSKAFKRLQRITLKK